MNRFLVTSHGWSASNWIAHAVNLHPDMLCTHSARNVLADDPNLQSDENLKKNLSTLHKGYINRTQVSLDDTYSNIQELGEAKWYGTVHVFRLRDLPVQLEKFKIQQAQMPVINVIRNPIDLVWSGYGQFKTLFELDVNELHWTLNKVFRLAKDFVIDLGQRHQLKMGSFDQLAFVGACAVLEGLKKDFDAVDVVSASGAFDFKGMWEMELLTAEPEAMPHMIRILTNDGIQIPESYIEAVAATGAINRHRSDQAQLRGKDRYHAFAPWQKECFEHFMDLFRLTPEYERHGYDLSFLR